MIQLRDGDGNVIATTSTRGNGSYEFCELAPGEYSVVEQVPDDFVGVTDSDGGNPTVINVDLGSIDSNNNNFVIKRERRCIKGAVQEDTDDDNEGKEGVRGVLIQQQQPLEDTEDTNSAVCLLVNILLSIEEVPDGFATE